MATRQQCERALDLVGAELSRRTNVVGLGIVPEKEETARRTGRKGLALAVYVSRKVAVNQLAPEDAIPPAVEIPGRKGTTRVPTRVIEQGEVRLESAGRTSR